MKFLFQLSLLALLATCLPATSAEQNATDDSESKTLIWPDGTRYVGGVRDGKRFGKGTIYWEDGTRFVGTFKNDMRNGPGTMILPDGTVYNGFFQDDQLVQSPSEPGAPEVDAAVLADTRPPASIEPADDPAVETVAATPAPDKAVTAPTTATPTEITELSTGVRQTLENTVQEWARAWQGQQVADYLGFYSAEFTVPGRQSRSAWEALRRSRLTRPGNITIGITFDLIEIVAPNVAEVTFRQTYTSDVYSDVTNKTLRLQKEANGWKILEERSN
ncbi:MAG: hypothetical protein ACFHX7_05710 [Pseudomonadota bacterium]